MAIKTETTKYTVVSFCLLLLGCVLILTLLNEFTRERIVDNRELATRRIIEDIIPGNYNNDIFNDSIEVTEPGYLGSSRPVTVYRARDGQDNLGVVFYPVIADGYNNQIELAVAVSRDGTITGVRVIREDETEGLGDKVNQTNSDWILSFTDKSYDNVPREAWRVESENGYFDQISGATITSRSVINTVRNTLDYHNIAQDTLYQ